MDFMNGLIDLYDKNREDVLQDRRSFRTLNPRNITFPIELEGEWGKDCTLEWVTEKIQNQIEDTSIY